MREAFLDGLPHDLLWGARVSMIQTQGLNIMISSGIYKLKDLIKAMQMDDRRYTICRRGLTRGWNQFQFEGSLSPAELDQDVDYANGVIFTESGNAALFRVYDEGPLEERFFAMREE